MVDDGVTISPDWVPSHASTCEIEVGELIDVKWEDGRSTSEKPSSDPTWQVSLPSKDLPDIKDQSDMVLCC